ncbi:hypothetical protein J7T55_009255 [Diaporthe amygdali]|uniref:uncharacterized protein n=1 Tax=Phomopsis amygdali TaxID=1214568 RepID=UPI0022FDBE22|nr:uncharacterized protein J7T55_009255 [Diaporthe amygdali]KAJ0118472.1 hypothetical protein J7T55_009255 [Diaporthe amygdali]
MAPKLDEYIIQMRNLHKRYGLSKNVMQLFKAFGEHHRGASSPEALGRWLRSSPLMRKACTDTISSLAKEIQKNPTPDCIAECGELISSCTEMLNLANESKQGTILPFMKFPAEIRRSVYQYYFNNLFTSHRQHQHNTITIIRQRPHNCICLGHQSYQTGLARRLQMDLIITCTQIKDEVLALWFEGYVFHFACGCELKSSLQTNSSLSNNLKNVKIHWTGQESAEAFILLRKVATLKSLVVVISKSTTNTQSEKERLLRRYFTQKGQTRVSEALGFDELMEFRGLEHVGVEHVQKSQAFRRSEEDRNGLEKLLKFVALDD